MAKQRITTKREKPPLTRAQADELKAAAIDVFEEAKKLDLKLKALKKASHILSVPFRYK